jgi:hypothetical protein
MSEQALIDFRLQQHRLIGQQICREMVEALHKIGFNQTDFKVLPEFDRAEFTLVKDPYTSDENLSGYWYDFHKHKIGNIQFLSDGSFYAEYDVVKPHPTKRQWFVEAISAWGKNGHIKTEAKLLPALQ